MNIAVNARFLLTNKLEGIGWFTYETLRRLVKWHPEHQFIFFFDRPYSEKFIFAENVKPVVLFPPARHPLLFYWWFDFSVAKALKKHQAKAFLTTDGFLSLNTAVPTLLVIHDLAHIHFPNQVKYLEQQYYNFFMPKFAQKAHRIATVSEFSKRDIHQQYHIPLAQIDVVYNGIRENFRRVSKEEKAKIKAKYADGQDYFFYVGAVHPRKNIHRLIAAFDRFKQCTNAPLKLLIAGRFAWQTDVIKDAYDQAIHQKDIRFLNYVQDAEVPLLLGSALGFVYISLFEGFGIPLLEAMRCEVPIITSNVSSMPEVVGDAGIKVSPESIEAIADAMEQLYNNVFLRKKLIEAGQTRQQQFSWDLTAKLLERSLNKVLAAAESL